MKQHLNTLFVTTQGAYLHQYGDALVVKVEEETKLQLPLHTLGGIVCFGRISMSPWLMSRCAEQGIAISFLSEQGKFLARVLRSEEHTSELQSPTNLVCRLLLEKKKNK